MDIHQEQHYGKTLNINIMKTIEFVLCLLSVFLFSCGKDEKLTLNKSIYLGNELKTDGCYYSIIETNKKLSNYIFLYKNGVVLNFVDTTGIKTLEDFNQNNLNPKNKSSWGVFIVSNSHLEIQCWSSSFAGKRYLDNSIAEIVNDTTFRIYKIINTRSGETDVNDLFYYMRFIPKPDSTNVFIK